MSGHDEPQTITTIIDTMYQTTPARIHSGPRALEELAALRQAQVDIQAAIDRRVAIARDTKAFNGTSQQEVAVTWDQIGAALGVSKQAARQKYGI